MARRADDQQGRKSARREGAPVEAPLRVGHKGAAHIAPGNTLASFEAALGAGVEMIELDVLPERADGSGELFIAHDYDDLHSRDALLLADALAHLAGAPYSELTFDVDLKLPGYGARVLEALDHAGLAERALLSCTYLRELIAIRNRRPQARLGWSVPRVSRDYTANPLTALPALLALGVGRRILPARARSVIEAGHADALMAHWRLISPALARAVRRAGGELFAWTVDDPMIIRSLSTLGVDGIITNDPRLFAASAPARTRALPERPSPQTP
jgi:glycerophosphoryl diester phosphodiesterase